VKKCDATEYSNSASQHDTWCWHLQTKTQYWAQKLYPTPTISCVPKQNQQQLKYVITINKNVLSATVFQLTLGNDGFEMLLDWGVLTGDTWIRLASGWASTSFSIFPACIHTKLYQSSQQQAQNIGKSLCLVQQHSAPAENKLINHPVNLFPPNE